MKSSLRNKAVKGVAWMATQSVGSQVSSFVVFLVLARMLEPAHFGLIAMADVSIAFLRFFTADTLSSAIVQRRNLEPEHLDSAFWLNVALGSVVVGLTILFSGQIADFYGQPEVADVLAVLTASLFCSTLSSVQISVLRRNLQFRSLAMRTLIGEPVGGVVGIVMAFSGFGVWSLVAKEIVSSLVQLVTLWSSSDWRPGFRFSFRHLRDLLAFGLNMLGASFLSFANKRLDRFLIGYALGTVALGYYSIAKRLVDLLFEFFSGSVNKVAWPIFSRVQNDHARLKRVFYETTQITALAAFPAFIGVAALAQEFVPVLFGEKWAPAAMVMQVLAMLGLLRSMTRFQESLIVGVGKSGRRLVLQIILAICNVVGFLIAVQWGLVAVATSYLVVGFVLAPLWIWTVQQLVEIELSAYFGLYMAPIVGSLLMLAAIFACAIVLGDNIAMGLRLLVCVVLGAAVYIVSVRVIYPNIFRQIKGTLAHTFSKRGARKTPPSDNGQ